MAAVNEFMGKDGTAFEDDAGGWLLPDRQPVDSPSQPEVLNIYGFEVPMRWARPAGEYPAVVTRLAGSAGVPCPAAHAEVAAAVPAEARTHGRTRSATGRDAAVLRPVGKLSLGASTLSEQG